MPMIPTALPADPAADGAGQSPWRRRLFRRPAEGMQEVIALGQRITPNPGIGFAFIAAGAFFLFHAPATA